MEAYDLIKENMEELYDNSGYGWDNEDKMRELKEKSARFLVATAKKTGKIVGFVHFRFTQIGECVDTPSGSSCVFCWDFQVAQAYQRKGLGGHMAALLTMIGRKTNVAALCMPVVKGNEAAANFLNGKLKGSFVPYNVSIDNLLIVEGGGSIMAQLYQEDDQFEVYTKVLMKFAADAAPVAVVAPVAEVVVPPPASEETPAVVDIERASPVSVLSSLPVEATKPSVVEETEKEAVLPSFGTLDLENGIFDDEELDVEEGVDDEDCEEDAILHALVDEFTLRNGREPTTDEINSWMGVLKQATEEIMLAGFGTVGSNPAEEEVTLTE